MTTLTLVCTWTAKALGEKIPDQIFMDTPTNMASPTYNFDPVEIAYQARLLASRDQVNATSVFKALSYPVVSTNADGLLVTVSTFTVEDMSTVPGLTVDNAYELCMSTRQADANAAGIGMYFAWRFAYYDDKFTRTVNVTTSP